MEGVYVTDRPVAALSSMTVIASWGPAGRSGYTGSEIISETGTLPLKVVIRCLADPTVVLEV